MPSVPAETELFFRNMETRLKDHFDEKIDEVKTGLSRVSHDFDLHRADTLRVHSDHERRLDETGSRIIKLESKLEAKDSEHIEIFGQKIRTSLLVLVALFVFALIVFDVPFKWQSADGAVVEVNASSKDAEGVPDDD